MKDYGTFYVVGGLLLGALIGGLVIPAAVRTANAARRSDSRGAAVPLPSFNRSVALTLMSYARNVVIAVLFDSASAAPGQVGHDLPSVGGALALLLVLVLSDTLLLRAGLPTTFGRAASVMALWYVFSVGFILAVAAIAAPVVAVLLAVGESRGAAAVQGGVVGVVVAWSGLYAWLALSAAPGGTTPPTGPAYALEAADGAGRWRMVLVLLAALLFLLVPRPAG